VRVGVQVVLRGHPWVREPLTVVEATQEWAGGNLVTPFTAVPSAVAAGFAPPPARGFEVLSVMQVCDNKDPRRLGRVRLRAAHDPTPTGWAVVAALGAARRRGSGWTPQVGDEVVVAFLGADLTRPVLLAGLYSADAPPPFQTPNGTEEVVLARTEWGEIRMVGTPGKEEVRITCRDNVVAIRPGSGARVLIQTAGDVEVSCANARIKAQKQFKVEADQIAMDARQSLEFRAGQRMRMQGEELGTEAEAGWSAPVEISGMPEGPALTRLRRDDRLVGRTPDGTRLLLSPRWQPLLLPAGTQAGAVFHDGRTAGAPGCGRRSPGRQNICLPNRSPTRGPKPSGGTNGSSCTCPGRCCGT
jgi:phage baseplate assembly protein gpV